MKLTVVHDGFEPGSVVASMVGQGWPRILSNLKTCSRPVRPCRMRRSRRFPRASG